MPSLDEPEPDVTEFTTTLAEGSPDWVLIRSLEWLTASEETYPDALVQANALIRFFLCASRLLSLPFLPLRSPEANARQPLPSSLGEGPCCPGAPRCPPPPAHHGRLAWRRSGQKPGRRVRAPQPSLRRSQPLRPMWRVRLDAAQAWAQDRHA